jgi:ATP:ADP antiporter, AAA family
MKRERGITGLATITSFLVIATFIAGKTARDATLLSNYKVQLLPTFVGISALVTIPLVLQVGRRVTQKGPAWLFPRMNMSSALLLVIEWFALTRGSRAASAVIYVHLAAVGPVLVSGFWSTINERLDPRAAKRAIARVGLGATFGGIAGGLVAQLAAAVAPASSIVLVVAGMQVICSGLLFWLGRRSVHVPAEADPNIWAGVQVIARSQLLRDVALLVVLGAMGAAALDYVFKAGIMSSAQHGPLKALAMYYTLTSVVTAIVQFVATDRTIAKLGVAGSAVALPITVTGAAAVLLVIPTAMTAAIARGAELVVRSSVYRAGYELLFAPLPAGSKRPAKVMLDVGAERFGDILGSQLISGLLFLAPGSRTAIVVATIVLGVCGVAVALHLPRAYTRVLEQRLLATSPSNNPLTTLNLPLGPASRFPQQSPITSEARSRVEDLRSGDRARVTDALAAPLTPELVPLAIPLLAWQPVSELATAQLRAIAPRVTGALVDVLLDPETDFNVKRRLPAVLEHGDPELASVGLWRALSDGRFEVRFRAGKALARVRDAGHAHEVPAERVFDAVLREVSVDVELWKGRRLLDGYEGPESEMRLYRVLSQRSATALDHVFTLLGLVLSAEPLRVALHALSTDDPLLQGTALEYLESVLPPRIRGPLWPFLELERTTETSAHSPHDIVAALDLDHPSIVMYLQEKTAGPETDSPKE